jgi:hypothetical protein
MKFLLVFLLGSHLVLCVVFEIFKYHKTTDNDIFYPYYLNISFGNKTLSNISIDTTTNYTWFYNSNLEGEIINDSYQIILKDKTEIKGQLIKYNNTSNNNTLLYINSSNILGNNTLGVIGIGRELSKNSFFNYSCNNSSGGENIILLIYSETQKKLQLYGKPNDTFTKDLNKTCNCSNSSSELKKLWNCEIKSYSINISEIKIENEYIAFSTFCKDIIASSKTGKIILNDYLRIINSRYGEKRCELIEENGFKKMRCQKLEEFEGIPDFSLITKDNNIKLTAIIDDLFENYNSTFQDFKIIYVNDNNENNIWYIGEPIIKNYNLLFNFDNGNIIIVESLSFGLFLVYIGFIIGVLILLIFLFMLYNARKKGDEISISLINK